MFPIRDTQRSYSFPIVTIVLIAVNLLAFLFELTLDPDLRDRFHIENIFTSMFLHGGWLHVLGNMWFLWIFGDNVEDVLGHARYLLFYLACGTAAAVTQVVFSLDSRVPMVGASGAIAGVMGAYLVKFPRARIETIAFIFFFITRFDVPAWLMLIYWFATQFLNGVGSIGYTQVNEGGTAFLAHVGGFVAGILLIYLMAPRERSWQRRDLYW